MHAAILAATWAVVPIVWFPNVDPQAQLVLGTVITGMICAGGFALATVPRAAVAYIVLLSVGSLIGLLTSDSPHRFLLTGLLVAYAVVVVMSATGTARLFIDRLVAEHDLRERGQVIALLLAEFEENGSDWLFELDRDYHIVKHSARFADVSQASGSRLQGLSLFSLIDGDSGDAMRARMESGRPFRDAEVSARGRHGQRWWSISASPIANDAGAIVGWRIYTVASTRWVPVLSLIHI